MTAPPDGGRRKGPAGENGAPRKNVDQDAATTVRRLADIRGEGALTSEVVARRVWAYRMLRRCDVPPPLYGSREWLDLPDGHFAKVAAVVVAAEAWARDGDGLEHQIAAQIEAGRAAFKAEEDRRYVARARMHREEWHPVTHSTRPSFVERRRRQLEDAGLTPEDVAGRGREGA
jgi:hypothetical protein